MTKYLDRDDVLVAGAAAVGVELKVADYGLLDAAAARPQATARASCMHLRADDVPAPVVAELNIAHTAVDSAVATALGAVLTVRRPFRAAYLASRAMMAHVSQSKGAF